MAARYVNGVYRVRSSKWFRKWDMLEEVEVRSEYKEKAHRMMADQDYQRKVADVMAVMAGKGLVRQALCDIIDRG